MNEIQGIARLKIHAGKLEEFKRAASQCMQVVRAKDTGTLQYELYFNEDQTECLVLERYRDVQALLQHQNNIGGLMGTPPRDVHRFRRGMREGNPRADQGA